MKKLGDVTFRDLDNDISLRSPESALEEWYIKVRDKKIKDLDVDDLARSCRQNIYIENVMPFCLNKLEENPLIGENYDGELIRSLKKISPDYWESHPQERESLLSLAKRAYEMSGDSNLKF